MLGRFVGAALALALAQGAAAQALRPDQARFREIYKQLVETNTTLSSGSCTLAAHAMGDRLKAAGFPDSDLTYFATAEHPKDGGLVAILPGRDPAAKAILLLGHLDVVEAKREDWTRDPFVLIEENGYFYGRGTSDMKVIDATWVDMLMRFKEANYRPRHTLKLALTCGEETTRAFNGADWLAKNKPDLIAAEFALNEGGGGRADAQGKVLSQGIQVGQKVVQQFRLETTNPGGHSSVPVRDNAIYELADALIKVRDLEFPIEFNDTTRAFLAKGGAGRTDAQGRAMVALAANPDDKAALGQEGAGGVVELDREFEVAHLDEGVAISADFPCPESSYDIAKSRFFQVKEMPVNLAPSREIPANHGRTAQDFVSGILGSE